MLVRVKDLKKFDGYVFGADCFLKNWPEIKTTGIEVKLIGEFYYVMVDGKQAGLSAFFSEEEMQYLEQVPPDVSSLVKD